MDEIGALRQRCDLQSAVGRVEGVDRTPSTTEAMSAFSVAHSKTKPGAMAPEVMNAVAAKVTWLPVRVTADAGTTLHEDSQSPIILADLGQEM